MAFPRRVLKPGGSSSIRVVYADLGDYPGPIKAYGLDHFGDSSSTLIAAEQTGRRAFLMEIDPAYCDVIVERWEKFTGRKAERRGHPACAL